MSAFDLSILIVTYNSAPFIGACLEALDGACAGLTYEIIVVDNASRDGSAAEVRRARPDAIVVELASNIGFSKANNRAMQVATGRHYLLLNGDAVCQPGALAALVAVLDTQPDVGIAAPALRNPDGTDQGTARSFPTPAAAVFGRRSPITAAFPRNRWSSRYLSGREHVGDEPFDVDWVSGACLMLSRRAVQRIGGLDSDFFMYWEDADLCRRAKYHGLRVLTVPNAVAVHREGSSSRAAPVRQAWRFHRSAYRYYAKHHAMGRRRPLRPLVGALLGARLAMVCSRALIVQRDRASHFAPPADSPAATTPRTER